MSVYSPSLTGEAGEEGPDGLEPPHVALEPAATPTTGRSGDSVALNDAGTGSFPSSTPSQSVAGGSGAQSGLHQPSSAPFPSSLVPVFIHRMEDTNLRDRVEFQFDLSLSVDENAMRMAEALYGPPPVCCSQNASGTVEPSSGPSSRPAANDVDKTRGPHCNGSSADISGVSCGLECLSDSGECVQCGHPVIYRICEAGAPPEPCDDTVKRSLKPYTQFLVTSFGEIDLADDLGGDSPFTASSRMVEVEPVTFTDFGGHHFGPKHWLLVKEGIHIILDRILLKDNTHLTSRCPLYGRLSRVEKRAAVIKYATALVLREPLHRNVLVDTISMCVYEACEQEAILEAPTSLDTRRVKPRVPFMQKVMGEAMDELLGEDVDDEDLDMIRLLLKQKAPDRVVSDALARMRDIWLGDIVSDFFARLTESDKPPPVIYCHLVAQAAGVDYFLPPVPEFDAEDERLLAEAIRTDEEDAGKETVFAANLKKALRLIKQSKTKSATTASLARASGGREDGFKDVRRGETSDDAAAIVFGSNKDWWSDQRWVAHYCRVSPATMIRQLRESPNGWFEHWMSLSERERKGITKLTAIETCDVIDNQPLWLSLRGMVGCNLYRDGIWPIISNDGHLSYVRFKKDDRERFWYIEDVDLTTLFPLFMAWAKTMGSSLRSELQTIGLALHEGRMDEVSRGIQSHLENAIVSFMLFKVVSKSMEAAADRVAGVLGDLLVEEEERAKAAKASKAGKKGKKTKEKEKDKKAQKKETKPVALPSAVDLSNQPLPAPLSAPSAALTPAAVAPSSVATFESSGSSSAQSSSSTAAGTSEDAVDDDGDTHGRTASPPPPAAKKPAAPAGSKSKHADSSKAKPPPVHGGNPRPTKARVSSVEPEDASDSDWQLVAKPGHKKSGSSTSFAQRENSGTSSMNTTTTSAVVTNTTPVAPTRTVASAASLVGRHGTVPPKSTLPLAPASVGPKAKPQPAPAPVVVPAPKPQPRQAVAVAPPVVVTKQPSNTSAPSATSVSTSANTKPAVVVTTNTAPKSMAHPSGLTSPVVISPPPAPAASLATVPFDTSPIRAVEPVKSTTVAVSPPRPSQTVDAPLLSQAPMLAPSSASSLLSDDVLSASTASSVPGVMWSDDMLRSILPGLPLTGHVLPTAAVDAAGDLGIPPLFPSSSLPPSSTVIGGDPSTVLADAILPQSSTGGVASSSGLRPQRQTSMLQRWTGRDDEDGDSPILPRSAFGADFEDPQPTLSTSNRGHLSATSVPFAPQAPPSSKASGLPSLGLPSASPSPWSNTAVPVSSSRASSFAASPAGFVGTTAPTSGLPSTFGAPSFGSEFGTRPPASGSRSMMSMSDPRSLGPSGSFSGPAGPQTPSYYPSYPVESAPRGPGFPAPAPGAIYGYGGPGFMRMPVAGMPGPQGPPPPGPSRLDFNSKPFVARQQPYPPGHGHV